jgi:hypothetical protein
MNKECPFCSLRTDRIIQENGTAFWILDGFPVSQGHSLIIPKRHVGSFFEVNAEERVGMLALLDEAQKWLSSKYQSEAFNIGINDGLLAGQTVPHLHMHLIPRYAGDVSDPKGGVRWVIPDKADYWSRGE